MTFFTNFRFSMPLFSAAALFIFICIPSFSAEDTVKKQPESPAAKKDSDKKDEKQNTAKTTDKTADAVKSGAKSSVKTDTVATAAQKPETLAKSETKPAESETIELKKEPLRITVKGIGTFESRKAEQIMLKGEEFTTFEIIEVVPHGTKVKQGEVLIKFDPQKYEEQYRKKKRALQVSEIALKQSEIEFRYLEKKQPLKLDTMEHEKKYADEDFVFFLNVEYDWTKRMADYRLGQARFYAESAKEELKQLEKMYKNDDLIEDTEEFILKRSRYILASQEFLYELDKMHSDRIKNVLMQRDDFAVRQGAKLRQLDYEQSKETFGFALHQAKIKLEESSEAHTKLVEQFEKFVKDKEQLTLISPSDGIVYYGEYNSKTSPGTWSNASLIAASMKPESTVSNKTVLFTVVNPKPVLVRTAAAEKDIHWIKTGTQGTIRPTAFPDTRYEVAVVERNDIPSAGNTFSALLAVELPDDTKIYPNMTGALDLIVYDKKEAILVPASALKKEETEDDSWNHSYLYTYGNNKTVNKVKVKTGVSKGDKTEVLDGVSAGQKIFKKFEEGEKAQSDKK